MTPASSKRPMREYLIDILRAAKISLDAGTLVETAAATYPDIWLPTTKKGVLKLVENDKKHYLNGTMPGPYIVPVLSIGEGKPRFSAEEDYFALSDFPIEARLMGDVSLRRRCFERALRILDLWESGQYPQWAARSHKHPFRLSWPYRCTGSQLTPKGCIKLRQDVLDELAKAPDFSHEYITPEIVAEAMELPEIHQYFGCDR